MKNRECLVAVFGAILYVSLSNGFIIPLKHGYRLDNGTPLTTLIRSSLLSCHEACLSRGSCKSFQLQRRFDLCHLSYNDSTDPMTSLITAPGFVYSEKKNWTSTTVAKVCTDQCSISDTCNPSDTRNPCTKTECEPPLPIRGSNSELRGSMRNIGARIAYICTNYTHLYNTSVCMRNGTWSKVYMDCPKKCGHIPMLRNGQFVLDKAGDSSSNATASIYCNEGYTLKPRPGIKSRCLHGGIWEHTGGKCEPVDCGKSPTIPHGHFNLESTGVSHYKAKAILQCDAGYSASIGTIECLSTGRWDDTKATCNIIDCGLPSVEHASYTLTIPNNTTYGATATLSCGTCYTGANVITRCEKNGQWNGTKISCAPNTPVKMSTTVVTSLDSRNYKIVNCGDHKWWHYDESQTIEYCPVTTKYQCDDNYCHFKFERMSDGSYKIKNVMTSVYLRDGNGAIHSGVLNGMKPKDEEHQHFMIYIQPSNMYTIFSKATKKYIRVDENKYVTSTKNRTDCYAWYTFIPV